MTKAMRIALIVSSIALVLLPASSTGLCGGCESAVGGVIVCAITEPGFQQCRVTVRCFVNDELPFIQQCFAICRAWDLCVQDV